MKKTRLNCLAVVTLAALALPNALAEGADCSPITQASLQGRQGAVQSIRNVESNVLQQVNQQRGCMERLSDAARQTVTVGSFDLGPVRQYLVQQACDSFNRSIDRELSRARADIGGDLSRLQNSATQLQQAGSEFSRLDPEQERIRQAYYGTGANPAAAPNVAAQRPQQSVWDRMANWLR